MFFFAGIDIGGSNNSWICLLGFDCKLKFQYTKNLPLTEIKEVFLSTKILGCAIDAPITYSLTLTTGMRSADREIKKLLPSSCKKWLLSYNALMGIPIRASILCQHISPYCGTIIETLPRANLYFMLPENLKDIALKYKENLSREIITSLLDFYEKNFDLTLSPTDIDHEGKIDALNCALTAFLYHRQPEKLHFLPQEERDLIGYGPFVIISNL